MLIILLVVSCNNKTNKSIPLTKGESIFIEEVFKRDIKLKDKAFLLYVLNPSRCSGCEKSISMLYTDPMIKSIPRIYAVSQENYKESQIPKNYLLFSGDKLAKYGLSQAHGFVFFLDNGNVKLAEPIDVQNVDSIIKNINLVYLMSLGPESR